MSTEEAAAGVLKDTKERNVICMRKKEWALLSLPVISITLGPIGPVKLQNLKTPRPGGPSTFPLNPLNPRSGLGSGPGSGWSREALINS